ncbi:hypothetical protein I3760_04G027800 [Carya illinoinensis]|nr:hypothetical protein I3760_04G027800 [Carya illinoinensis]KAG6656529.1 hypothetical protein CIPAW_04G028800 [Carya illinoinensis]
MPEKDLPFLWLSFASPFFKLATETRTHRERMAMASWSSAIHSERQVLQVQVFCRKKDKNRDNFHPYKVIEITPPPRNLGIRCFPSNLQCGESVTIEGQAYTISAVTHRYQLRKGKYEPSEKRLDVLSTGRYILNLYLESLLEQS